MDIEQNVDKEVHEEKIINRASELFNKLQKRIFKQIDHVFAVLMMFQWVLGVVIAYFISPKVWTEAHGQNHIHVWASMFLGSLIIIFPLLLILILPGKKITRHVIAISQMLTSALLIHLTGGRTETHFHVFGSLAQLAFYRDWTVLISASIVIALDQLIRGMYWPQSVYGILTYEPWRWFEHTGWIIFEDIFLITSIVQGKKEMYNIALKQAKMEAFNETIETRVKERTLELEQSEQKLRNVAENLNHSNKVLQSEVNERRETERRIATEHAAALVLSQSNTIEEGSVKILNVICKSLGYDFGAIWGIDKDENVLKCVNYWCASNINVETFIEACKKITLPPGVGLPGKVWASGKYIFILDALKETKCPRINYISKTNFHSAFAIPITLESKIIGVMEFFSTETHKPDPTLLRMLTSLGSEIGQFMKRKEFETELTEAQSQLLQAEKMSSMGEMASGVAHELTQPLLGISGFAQTIKNDFEKFLASEYLSEADMKVKIKRTLTDIDVINNQVSRMITIIKNIRDFARAPSSEKTKINVNKPIQGSLQLFLEQLRLHNIKIEQNLKESLPLINANSNQLQQVFVNLISNSRDAIDEKNGREPNNKKLIISTSITSDGKFIEVEFEDTGTGMDNETLQKIFRPFFTTKATGKGTGLGMSIAERIIKDHGGEIKVNSELGIGTKFNILLPVASN